MFSDPQSVTVNAVAQSMPRVQTQGRESTYQKSDQTYTLTIGSIQSKDRVNTRVRLDQRKVVADPLTAVNDYETLSVSLLINRPLAGFSMTECEQLIAGFKTWLDNTAIDKLYGQES
jgi:hypothetical protein